MANDDDQAIRTSFLDNYVQKTSQPVVRPINFRANSVKVGTIYTMTYQRAVVAVFDYDREKAGGLPKGGFLLAAKQEGDENFILLRILKEARLPSASEHDLTRQHSIEDTSNKSPWPEALDDWTKTKISLHGIECRVLGTFMQQEEGGPRYAEDTDNYYAVNELMAWKPDSKTLFMIVNYCHRNNAINMGQARKKIGQTRFSAAERNTATKADMLLDPTDLLKRRTVYLGMSRSGKSNAMKITAEQVYRLREIDPEYKIGQLIFDPNGEYAQDNEQDGLGLHRIHTVLGRSRDEEVATYGLYRPPSDQDRKVMKINFFGEQFPAKWTDSAVARALEQMLAGRQIIQDIMENESVRYTTAFRDVDISIPEDTQGNTGNQIRYQRAVLAYQTALAAAGLEPPNWKPSIKGLFNDGLIKAMKDSPDTSGHVAEYHEAAEILKKRKSESEGVISWDQLRKVFSALNLFIGDSKSGYRRFDDDYISKSSEGEGWADERLKNLIRIFTYQNGPRTFQVARQRHDPNSAIDFADDVVQDLQKGKLVIIDQSTGDPEQNRMAAERIMWKVFRTQQEAFITRNSGEDTNCKHILVYVEEAHNLLPRANATDNLRTVWARAAKEGSKMNIGMVLATQAPSSIMPEILSETDNWILAYLNSENERKVISGYMDFEDFLEQIGKVSEPGFARVRTLSLPYTIPVQFDRFKIPDPEE